MPLGWSPCTGTGAERPPTARQELAKTLTEELAKDSAKENDKGLVKRLDEGLAKGLANGPGNRQNDTGAKWPPTAKQELAKGLTEERVKDSAK